MWIKIIIVVLFLLLLISLLGGFNFLIKDQGDNKKNRLWNILTLRVTLTVLLLFVIISGVLSGALTAHSPWGASTPETRLENIDKQK